MSLANCCGLHTQRLGLQVPPLFQVPVQFTCVVTVQVVPMVAQQEPVGGGQGLGLQVPPLIQEDPVQFASVVDVQSPLVAQQEPVGGCGQVLGLQVPPLIQEDPVQFACVVGVQSPLVAQQAPVGEPELSKRTRITLPRSVPAMPPSGTIGLPPAWRAG
jgi:hypothetical protein